MGRFINADDTANLGADDGLTSFNLFIYCSNNPVNRFDPTGNWSLPNWVKVVVGAVATVAAVAITVSTGGAALPLLAGVAASTVTNGALGYITGGTQGMIDGLCNGFMWGGIGALGASVVNVGIKTLQEAGKLPIKVNIDKLVNNPDDEFVTIGPKDGKIAEYVSQISQTGDYGQIFVTQLADDAYQIANGHHRVEALRILGYEIINVFLTE